MYSTPSLSPERRRGRLGTLIAERAARWARRRQGTDPSPVRLESRRIYILPTGVGITFGLMVFAMLLGSMNYNNSMGFALTFLLAALGLVAMHHCHRNLAGLVVGQAGAEPVFAGEPVTFAFSLGNDADEARYDLAIRVEAASSERVDVPGRGTTRCEIRLPTRRRGRLTLPRIGVRTHHPLALFRAWAWIHGNVSVLVWPRPADNAPPPPPADLSRGHRNTSDQGDEDFAGLRDFRDGDPPRHVAWKTYARSAEMKSKRFAGADVSRSWLDLGKAPGRGLEEKLSVLARWIVDAENEGREYGLILGAERIEASRGLGHRARCLDALAEYAEVAPDAG